MKKAARQRRVKLARTMMRTIPMNKAKAMTEENMGKTYINKQVKSMGKVWQFFSLFLVNIPRRTPPLPLFGLQLASFALVLTSNINKGTLEL